MNKQPKLTINQQGTKLWYLNGELHCEDGPAVERTNGDKQWWLNGELHRIDGPAIENANGIKYWYLNDIQYSYDEWLQQLTPKQQIDSFFNLNE
jgi:hypothetical protein